MIAHATELIMKQRLKVKGFPNVVCKAYSGCSGFEYNIGPSKKVAHVTLSNFRSWDDWTYLFYDKRTGTLLGTWSVEVENKNGEHQDPPQPHPYFKKLVAEINGKAKAIAAVA